MNSRIGDPPKQWRDVEWLIHDPNFVFRGRPGYPGHDALGYRNSDIPSAIDTLILGDSQVYGTGVDPTQCWPSLIAQVQTGNVYNAAMGGNGLFQYALALEELLPLSPRRVVVVIYHANDLIEGVYHATMSESPLVDRLAVDISGVDAPDASCTTQKEEFVRAFQQQHPGADHFTAMVAGQENGVPDCNLAELNGGIYVLTDTFRFTYMDLQQEVVKRAMEMVDKLLSFLRDMSHLHGFNLSVISMPTKEYLFFLRQADISITNRESLERLGKTEAEVTARIKEISLNKGLSYFDLAEPLASRLHLELYSQRTDDGHPNAVGHQIIATIINKHLVQNSSVLSRSLYPLY